MTKRMTIHAALGELKKLGQRIDRATYNSTFVGNMKNSADRVNNSSLSEDEFKKAAVASFQSITDLIAERDRIKSAIVLSNATTNVLVGEVTMTVAEAIEKKTSIQYKKELLSRMKRQYKDTVSTTTTYNERMEENLDAQIINLSGKDGSGKAKLGDFSEQYRSLNGWKNIDPLNIQEKIETLENEILDFETNVDTELSVSNATTFIEI